MQKDHKKVLWEYLQANPGWHTSSELAVAIGVSTRSIKRYVKDLVDTSAIFVSEKGYKINQKITNKKSSNMSYDSVKRVLINEFTRKQSLNVYDLSERFYLSESTLIKLLGEITHYFKSFNLELRRSGDNWFLDGDELNKRKVISDVLYRESGQTFIGTKTIQESFPDIKVKNLANNIREIANSQNIYLNVFDFNNVLLHVAIATHRSKNGYQPQSDLSKKTSAFQKNSDKNQGLIFSKQLIDQIEKSEKLKFSDEERRSLMLVIQFSITRKHRNLEDTINHETAILVDQLIKYVSSMLNIDLKSLNFRDQFAIHIQRLLERSSHGYVERNPMTSRIRKSSPIIYECAVLISNRLEELKNVSIDDDEIAYIAMHIGNAVSEYINELHKLYVIVLLPDYQIDNNSFVSRLERLFSQDIVVGGVVNTPEQLQENHYPRKIDFVVQVNSNYVLSNVVYANISQFLTQYDYRQVNTIVETVRHKQERDNFTNNLRQFFSTTNFEIVSNKMSRDKLFKTICNKLEEKNVVDKDFVNQLKKREEMSSTAFGKVAIPHSLQMSALKTQGYIVIAPKGIRWDETGNEVNLVFVLAVNKDNKNSYRNIFDDLSQIAIDPKNISKLISSKNYDEFVEELAELL
ncbi:PTS sugar transporter subunit IIA [Pediococcus ethanolidurans]